MKPNYTLSVLDKSNDNHGIVGAGWSKPDGSISIAINPGCALIYHPNLVVRLFPTTRKPGRDGQAVQPEPDDPSV